MKKEFAKYVLLPVLIIIILIIIVICVPTSNKTTKHKTKQSTDIKENKHTKNVSVYTDKKTGVQYLIYSDVGVGITPRLNKDGTVMVVKKRGK